MSTAPKEQPRQSLETGSKALDDYMVYPRDKFSPEEIDRTDSAIRQIVGPEAAAPQKKMMGLEPKFLMFWLGPLTESQVVEIERLDGVSSIEKDGLDPDYNRTNP